jgi:hypothetical protein
VILALCSLVSTSMERNEISPERFFLEVLKESKRSSPTLAHGSSGCHNLSGNPYLEPPTHHLFTTFHRLCSSESLPYQIENQCYKALLLFTADNSLHWDFKLHNIQKYFINNSAEVNSSSSRPFQSIEHGAPRFSSSVIAPHSPPTTNGETLDSDVILLSDLLNSKTSAPLRAPVQAPRSPTSPSAPSSKQSRGITVGPLRRKPIPTTPDLTPIMRSKGVPSPERNLLAMTQDGLNLGTTLTTRFSNYKTHDHSSPLFISSPLNPSTTYVTDLPIGTPHDRDRDSHDLSEGMLTLPHLIKTTPLVPGTPSSSSSRAVQRAEKYWNQKCLFIGFHRILWYCQKRKGILNGHTIQSPEKRFTKLRIFQLKKSNKLLGLTRHQQRQAVSLSTTRLISFPDAALGSPSSPSSQSLTEAESNSSPTHSVRDILPSPSTIRILALFERYIIQRPSSSTADLSNLASSSRHPAPFFYVYMTKLSPRYNLTDTQELWLRKQIIQFLRIETLKVCYYLWCDMMSLLVLSKDFYKNKMLRKGLEALQDYSLARSRYQQISVLASSSGGRGGSRNSSVPANESQRYLQQKLSNFQKLKFLKVFKSLKQFCLKQKLQKKLQKKTEKFSNQKLLFFSLCLWRDHWSLKYKLIQQNKLKIKNKLKKEISLFKIFFQRFYFRIKIFPRGYLLRIKTSTNTKFSIFWKWFHIFQQRKSMRKKYSGTPSKTLLTVVDDSHCISTDYWNRRRVFQMKYWNKFKYFCEKEKEGKEELFREAEKYFDRTSLLLGFRKWKRRRAAREHHKKTPQRMITKLSQLSSPLSSSSRFPSFFHSLSSTNTSHHPSTTYPYRSPTLLIQTFYLRWKKFAVSQLTSREKILKYSKSLRLLFGYPVNTGRSMISVLCSISSPHQANMIKKTGSSHHHPSFGYKSYSQVYEMNLGSLPSTTPVKYLPIQLLQSFQKFSKQIQKLKKLRSNSQEKSLHFLRKKFKIFQKQITVQRKSHFVIQKRIRKVFIFWKFQFVYRRCCVRRKLIDVWIQMRRYAQAKRFLRFWYASTDCPLLHKGFQQMKRVSQLYQRNMLLIKTSRQRWREKYFLHQWRLIFQTTQWHQKRVTRRCYFKYFKNSCLKTQHLRSRVSHFLLSQHFKKFLRRSRDLSQQILRQNRHKDILLLRRYFVKKFSIFLQKMKLLSHQKKSVTHWSHHRSLHHVLQTFRQYISQRKRREYSSYLSILSFRLWKLMKKIQKLKSQRNLLRILSSYYSAHFTKRYFKKWILLTKKKIIQKKKIRNGQKFFLYQKQSFAVTLLKNLANI